MKPFEAIKSILALIALIFFTISVLAVIWAVALDTPIPWARFTIAVAATAGFLLWLFGKLVK